MLQMRRFIKGHRLVALTVSAVLAVAGAAFAYWTTTGSGTGSATTGQGSAVTVAQTGAVTLLAPGAASQPVNFTVNNPKTTPQYVTTVTFAISSLTITVGGAPATGCTAADFTLVQPTWTAADLAAGTTTYAPSGGSLAMIDRATNQDACKGVTVNLAFTST